MGAELKKIRPICWVSALYFVLLPLTISVNSNNNSYLKLATIPIGLFLFISLLFYKEKLNINIVHIFLIIYTLSLTLTWIMDPGRQAINDVIGYFLNCALFMCISIFNYNERELRLLENAQILMLVIVCAITLQGGALFNGRGTIIVFGDVCDPNYFVGFFVFPLAVTVKKIAGKSWLWKIPYVLLAALSMYLVFLSGSRGGLLAVIVMIGAFVIIYPKGIKNKILVAGFALALGLITWFVAKPLLPQDVVNRMSVDAVVESRGTYRMDIWEKAIEEVFDESEHALLGRGLNAQVQMIINGKYQNAGIHNVFLHSLYAQGLVGFLLFSLLAAVCILRCIKGKKIVAIAMIGMLALGMSLAFNSSHKMFWNLVCYAAMPFAAEQTREENKTLEEEKIT